MFVVSEVTANQETCIPVLGQTYKAGTHAEAVEIAAELVMDHDDDVLETKHQVREILEADNCYVPAGREKRKGMYIVWGVYIGLAVNF